MPEVPKMSGNCRQPLDPLPFPDAALLHAVPLKYAAIALIWRRHRMR